MNVLLTGATGFVGSRLAVLLREAGHQVSTVSRGPSGDHDWSDESLAAGVKGADAILHLAGAGIFDKRWSPTYKQVMTESRLDTTRRLAQLAAATRERAGTAEGKAPGGVRRFITASAVGYYGASDGDDLNEESPTGADFLARLCQQWEAAAEPARQAGISTASVRIGVVLGQGGGALAKMLLPFKLGLGGPMGSGRQWMSWVHLDDLCALFVHLLEHEEATGAFNGTAPNPVRMTDFAKALGRQLHRPAVLPAPGFAMKLLLGEVAYVLLTGQCALPKRSLEAGCAFRYGELDAALAQLLG